MTQNFALEHVVQKSFKGKEESLCSIHGFKMNRKNLLEILTLKSKFARRTTKC